MPIVEPEDGNGYGMKAASTWIDEDDLPVSRGDLEEYGDREIMLAFDEEIRFSDVLEHVDDEGPWEEMTEMWRALGPGFRAVNPRVQDRYVER